MKISEYKQCHGVMIILLLSQSMALLIGADDLEKSLQNAHNVDIKWVRNVGGPAIEALRCVVADQAGNVCAGGVKGWNAYVVNIDSTGQSRWEKVCGFKGEVSEANGIAMVQGRGGYVIRGQVRKYGAVAGKPYLIALGENGEERWRSVLPIVEGRVRGSNRLDSASDGDWVFMSPGDKDDGGVRLIRANNTGKLKKVQDWGIIMATTGSFVKTKDGDYALTGATGYVHGKNSDVVVCKVDPLGSLRWNKTIERAGNEGGEYLAEHAGKLWIVAWSEGYGVPGAKILLIVMDNDGSDVRVMECGVKALGASGAWIAPRDDNGFVLSGTCFLGNNDERGWDGLLVGLDKNGGVEWQESFGGGGSDYVEGGAMGMNHEIINVGSWLSERGLYNGFVMKYRRVGSPSR